MNGTFDVRRSTFDVPLYERFVHAVQDAGGSGWCCFPTSNVERRTSNVLILLLLLTCSAMAGEPPRIGYIYPAGVARGQTVEIEIGGQRVMETTAVYVNGGGVTATLMASKEDPDAEKKKGGKRKNIIEGRLKVSVAVAPDAEPGMRGLWLVTPTGISNTMAFAVGQFAEVNEVEAAPGKPMAPQKLPDLPVTVNGVITPGDADRFHFSAKAGQRLVARVDARSLVPYIADAVPGWFQAVLTLFDANGKEVAYADDFRFSPDPVLFFDVPATGDYAIEIRDALYRGREDFTYRIAIGELPHITDIFPLGAPRGGKATVQVTGRNLPAETLRLDVRADGPRVQEVRMERNGLLSNAVPFAAGDLAETMEKEREAGLAQEVTPPLVINGRIQAPGEVDWYRFNGTKGQTVVVEVQARRLGSPLDSAIALLDAEDKVVAENDDFKEDGEGLMTHHADSYLKCVLPADGVYRVRLREAQGKGGDAFAYRLRISEPRPGFALRAVPAAVAVPRGGSASFAVHVLRFDDYKGPIDCVLDGVPAGLTLDGGRIGAGATKPVMTVSAGLDVPTGMVPLRMTGTGIGEKPWQAPVVPAEDLMQAFYYRHLVPAAAQLALVVEPARGALSFAPPTGGAWELPRGKETDLTVTVARQTGFDAPIQLTLVDPPKGVVLRRGFIPQGKDSAPVTVRIEAKSEAPPDLTLVFLATAYVPIPGETTPDGKEKKAKVTFTGKAVAVKVVDPPKPAPAKPAVAAKPKPATPTVGDKTKPVTAPTGDKARPATPAPTPAAADAKTKTTTPAATVPPKANHETKPAP